MCTNIGKCIGVFEYLGHEVLYGAFQYPGHEVLYYVPPGTHLSQPMGAPHSTHVLDVAPPSPRRLQRSARLGALARTSARVSGVIPCAIPGRSPSLDPGNSKDLQLALEESPHIQIIGGQVW